MTKPESILCLERLMNAATHILNTSDLKSTDEEAYWFIKDRVREVANFYDRRAAEKKTLEAR